MKKTTKLAKIQKTKKTKKNSVIVEPSYLNEALKEIYKLDYNESEYLIQDIVYILKCFPERFKALLKLSEEYPLSKIFIIAGMPILNINYTTNKK